MIVDFTRRGTCQRKRNSRIVRRNARPAWIYSAVISPKPSFPPARARGRKTATIRRSLIIHERPLCSRACFSAGTIITPEERGGERERENEICVAGGKRSGITRGVRACVETIRADNKKSVRPMQPDHWLALSRICNVRFRETFRETFRVVDRNSSRRHRKRNGEKPRALPREN